MKLFSVCKINLCCLLSLIVLQARSQRADSAYYALKSSLTNCRFRMKELYFPAFCIALGSYSNPNETFIDNGAIKTERNEDMPHFRTHVDDYMQYAPIFAGYACIAAGSQTNAWLYTKEVMLNEVILNVSVYSVKHLSKVPSIVNGSYNAFPSGHTSQAFSAATLFSDNFAKGKPWLQCLSYGSATAVGVLRICNGRHWTSDVVAGVGFGILSAKISEWALVPHCNKKHSLNTNY